MEDIMGDFLLERFADPVYGVVPGDQQATEARRAEKREERGAKAVPVREWMANERQRLLDHDLIEPVQRMYAESMRLSERWAREFREFWDLPDNFDFPVPTPQVEISKALEAAAQ
jgi:acetone carboxylase, alpha subunit